MTLQEHLIEFRTRLVRSILAIFAGMIVGFIFAQSCHRLDDGSKAT